MPVIPPALTDLFRLEHPIAAPELVLRKIPTVLSEAKRSSSHSPHRGRNSTFRELDVGSPTCILAEGGDRGQRCDLLAALDDECS